MAQTITTAARALREAREAKALSVIELAHLSGVTERAIRYIESGEVKTPQWSTARALAAELDIDPHLLRPQSEEGIAC